MRYTLLLLVCLASTAWGQDGASADPDATPYPPVVQVAPVPPQALSLAVAVPPAPFVLTITAATTPQAFTAFVAGASPAAILQSLATADASPDILSSLLAKTSRQARMRIVLALQSQIATAHVEQPADLDVFAAFLTFASQDPRYQDISGYSYFGRQLAEVRQRIKTEGMTAANKSALVAIYHDATAALKSDLAAQAAEDSR